MACSLNTRLCSTIGWESIGYTVWVEFDQTTPNFDAVVGEELYDHRNDLTTMLRSENALIDVQEHVNLATDPTFENTRTELFNLVRNRFE